MEETNTNTGAVGTTNKRPGFITVLCILTFIGSGLSTLIYFLALILFGALSETLAGLPGFDVIATAGMSFIIPTFVLALASLFGAIWMWKLKKTGFYLYTVAQILLIIVPFVTVSGYNFAGAIFGIIVTAAFIIMYGVNLKHMS